MDNQYILYIVLFGLIAYVFWREIRPILQKMLRERRERLAVTRDATALLAGTMKACEAIAAVVAELRDAVKEFKAVVIAPGTTASATPDRVGVYPKDNFMPPPTEEDAERYVNTFERVLRGMPVAQAQAEADEEAEKKMMVSATAIGMEE